MSARITFCGHSTIILESEKGKRFLIDPFLEGNPKCPPELHDPGHIDYICLSHGHADHASSTVAIAKKYGSTVFATYELAALLAKDGVPEENIQFMNKGGRVEIPNGEGLAVTLTNAYHSSSYDAADGNTYYAGEACGLVIELESGVSIYHAGDTCLFDDMKLIGDLVCPEIALLPIGDRFTMGPKDAAEAAARVGAKVVIPIHFGTFDALSGTPEEFITETADLDCKIVVLEPGEEHSI